MFAPTILPWFFLENLKGFAFTFYEQNGGMPTQGLETCQMNKPFGIDNLIEPHQIK